MIAFWAIVSGLVSPSAGAWAWAYRTVEQKETEAELVLEAERQCLLALAGERDGGDGR